MCSLVLCSSGAGLHKLVSSKPPPDALTMGFTSFPSLSCRSPSVKGPPQYTIFFASEVSWHKNQHRHRRSKICHLIQRSLDFERLRGRVGFVHDLRLGQRDALRIQCSLLQRNQCPLTPLRHRPPLSHQKESSRPVKNIQIAAAHKNIV